MRQITGQYHLLEKYFCLMLAQYIWLGRNSIYIWVLGHVYIKRHWCPYGMPFDDYDGQSYPGMDGA